MFVDVIVPVSVPNTYTYGVPVEYHDEVEVGQRVEVEFGKRKRYAAVIVKIHNNQPEVYEPKPILNILDATPIITTEQLQFWKWMSNYYMANIGDILTAALPSALRLTSESTVQLLIENDFDADQLTDDEFLVFEALSNQQELTIEDIQLILDKKKVYPILTSLIEKRIIAMKETLKRKYKPKTKWFVRLSPEYASEEKKKELLDDLERAPKQSELAMYYLSAFPDGKGWMERKKLVKKANTSTSVFKSLIEKGYFVEEERTVDRLVDNSSGSLHAELSVAQQKALNEVEKAFSDHKPCLLHGVTGSGKTHIYIRLIEQELKKGNQVLYLLPEIALTSQIIQRLKKHFGNDVGVYHSKFNESERVEIWNKTFDETYKIIVGARSSIFLPFQQLSLIVVDEEHDSSYKQYDPSPRYHARDCAIWLGAQQHVNVLLGTATPSFESYLNTQQEKYSLVELIERYGAIQLPTIEVVNMLKQHIPGKTYRNFSKRLIDELKELLAHQKQAILLRNRRGYSSFVQCGACAHNIKCDNCDVTLTYHKYRDQLECHYCGFQQKVPHRCPACGHNELERVGLGTERIQEELNVFLPSATIERMDLDTTRNKHGHEKIIRKFEQKKIDILVGTQMVSKGLHFEDVHVVGVIHADAILKFPDFRASERAFQLLEQVSGRAGRKEKQGLVLIQVRDEDDMVLRFLKQHDYQGFFNATIQERWEFKYPPFYRLIKITLKHKDWKTCFQAAKRLSNEIKANTNQGVKGPSEPLVSKVRNQFLQEILITIQKKQEVIGKTKQLIHQKMDLVQGLKGHSRVRIVVDVDPM